MPDRISTIQRSENMRRIKSKNTKPELLVRRLVYQMGYRYRIHRKDLPGKPDLAFISKRKAIFVHGCFWHGHEAATCRDGRSPKSNEGYGSRSFGCCSGFRSLIWLKESHVRRPPSRLRLRNIRHQYRSVARYTLSSDRRFPAMP